MPATSFVVVDDGPERSGQRGEPAGGDLDAGGGRDGVLELVGLVDDHDVVLGQHRPAGRQVQAVEVGVHDDDVGVGGGPPGLLGEAVVALGALAGPGALARPDADRGPRPERRLAVELGPVAGLRRRGPSGELGDLLGGRPRADLEGELLSAARARGCVGGRRSSSGP